MNSFFAETVRTLRRLAQIVLHGGGGPIPQRDYARIIAANTVNRILQETEYTSPKRGCPRNRMRERPRFA